MWIVVRWMFLNCSVLIFTLWFEPSSCHFKRQHFIGWVVESRDLLILLFRMSLLSHPSIHPFIHPSIHSTELDSRICISSECVKHVSVLKSSYGNSVLSIVMNTFQTLTNKDVYVCEHECLCECIICELYRIWRCVDTWLEVALHTHFLHSDNQWFGDAAFSSWFTMISWCSWHLFIKPIVTCSNSRNYMVCYTHHEETRVSIK